MEELEGKGDVTCIKTERWMGTCGGNPWTTVHTTPWSGAELNELQDSSCKLDEAEYLWIVSLTGGDQMLLSDYKVGEFWGSGVFLSNKPPGNELITFWVAY